MKIRAGYEISYDCPQPTPMILTLSVHPSRFSDLRTPNLVRVAVVREPREAIPLQGTWIGTTSDHLAMKVTVKVVAVADIEAGRGKHVRMRTLTPA